MMNPHDTIDAQRAELNRRTAERLRQFADRIDAGEISTIRMGVQAGSVRFGDGKRGASEAIPTGEIQFAFRYIDSVIAKDCAEATAFHRLSEIIRPVDIGEPVTIGLGFTVADIIAGRIIPPATPAPASE